MCVHIVCVCVYVCVSVCVCILYVYVCMCVLSMHMCMFVCMLYVGSEFLKKPMSVLRCGAKKMLLVMFIAQ